MLPQIATIVALLLLVCGGFAGKWQFWVRFFGGVSLATFAISTPKLEAMLAVTGNLPRDLYPLPGFQATDLPLLLLQTLLWIPNTELLNGILENEAFYLGWHEWNYSVSPVWFLLVVSGLLMGRLEGTINGKAITS